MQKEREQMERERSQLQAERIRFTAEKLMDQNPVGGKSQPIKPLSLPFPKPVDPNAPKPPPNTTPAPSISNPTTHQPMLATTPSASAGTIEAADDPKAPSASNTTDALNPNDSEVQAAKSDSVLQQTKAPIQFKLVGIPPPASSNPPGQSTSQAPNNAQRSNNAPDP